MKEGAPKAVNWQLK